MSDPYDINKLISDAKKSGAINDPSVPLLGYQPPVMSGIQVNDQTLTINELESLSERDFRELFLATIITLTGGFYVPAAPVDTPEQEQGSVDVENTN